jgi:hypothetical protein
MSTCPQCQKRIRKGVKFCPACGNPLQTKDSGSVLKASTGSPLPEGKGLARAFTTITSPRQRAKYVISGVVLSSFGFFIASIPLGTATLVVGRVLLRNQVKTWGYLFCVIGTLWAVGLPILNLLSLMDSSSISIIPQLPKFLWS